MTFQLYHGDCLDVMAGMDANSVDAIVCDPPYGLSFMGKFWDHGVPGVHFWTEALRVAKPGAHLLAFGGTRTFHRLAVAIEDAGWELRDTLSWLYGSGFPKSHDVSKAIDKMAGAEPIPTGEIKRASIQRNGNGETWKAGAFASHPEHTKRVPITAPATPDAQQWAGYGTALKPAWEPIIMARKPFRGTVAANVLEWGTGAINVDACRVEGEPWKAHDATGLASVKFFTNGDAPIVHKEPHNAGRWPANLVHDGSDEVTRCFPVANGSKPGSFQREMTSRGYKGGGLGQRRADDHEATDIEKPGYGDTGSASRFFPALPLDAEDVDAARVLYCSKASKRDRDDGCEGLPLRGKNEVYGNGLNTATKLDPALHTAESVAARPQRNNHHPTVKPTALMRWLVRLVTPPGGVVLDPFMGSGSTGKAATLEGFDFIGIEMEAEYIEIARRRIEAAQLPLLATG